MPENCTGDCNFHISTCPIYSWIAGGCWRLHMISNYPALRVERDRLIYQWQSAARARACPLLQHAQQRHWPPPPLCVPSCVRSPDAIIIISASLKLHLCARVLWLVGHRLSLLAAQHLPLTAAAAVAVWFKWFTNRVSSLLCSFMVVERDLRRDRGPINA